MQKVMSSVNFLNYRATTAKFGKLVVQDIWKQWSMRLDKDSLLCEWLAAKDISWKMIIQTEWSLWYCIALSLESLAKADFDLGLKNYYYTPRNMESL